MTCFDSKAVPLLALLLVAACGDDNAADPDASPIDDDPDAAPIDDPDAGLTDPDAGPPRACAGAVFETIDEGPLEGIGALGSSEEFVISPAGDLHVAFGKDTAPGSAIYAADRDEGGWSEPVQVSGNDGRGSRPSMVEHDGALHLVWTHSPPGTRAGDPNRDVYYSTRAASGGAWSDPANVTGLYESALGRDGVTPSIAVSAEGEIVVAYESGQRDIFMDILLGTAGRVIQIQDGAAAGPPVEAIPPTFEGCYTNRPQFTADGSLHVVSICDEGEGEALLFHAVRTDDEWAEASRVKANPRGLAVTTGPDGLIHAAWGEPCSGGSDECGLVAYAVLGDGDLTRVANVTMPSGASVAGIAVRQDGRVAITLSTSLGVGLYQALVLDSADGETFDLCDLTPSPDTDESVADVAFDQDTGAAHIVFTRDTSTTRILEHAVLP